MKFQNMSTFFVLERFFRKKKLLANTNFLKTTSYVNAVHEKLWENPR